MKLRLLTAIMMSALCMQAHAATPAAEPAPAAAPTQPHTPAANTATTAAATSTAQPAANPSAKAMEPTGKPAAANAHANQTAAPHNEITIPKITADKQKVSYGIGVDLGENFKQQGIEIDSAMVARGLQDAMSGNKMLYSQQELASVLMEFQKQLIAKRQAEFNLAASKNLQQSANFLQSNKTKPNVVTTASGLQYKVINPGTGNSPTDKDVVTVDYVGTLPNGQVFDSSYKRGKPVTFPVSEVIPGWTEALKLMKPGATYEIYVPANLAYGERGLPPVIGPNQALMFKIHLIAVNPPAATKNNV